MPRSPTGRRTIRLRGHDYTRPGWYFVTICTYERRRVLCALHGGSVVPSQAGRIVVDAWCGLAARFSHVQFDRFVLMPDHLHAIIAIRRPDPRATGPSSRFGRGVPGSLATIVGSFKSASTKLIHAKGGMTGHVWQSNYYERIIRNNRALIAVRRYIAYNPVKWGRP